MVDLSGVYLEGKGAALEVFSDRTCQRHWEHGSVFVWAAQGVLGYGLAQCYQRRVWTMGTGQLFHNCIAYVILKSHI